MSQLHTVFSPVFPIEKDSDVPSDEIPLVQTSTIQVFIQLAEPVVFIQGFESQEIAERPPSILRGSLIVRVLKPSKLKNISLAFKGYSRTDWPEGIPPKKQEFVEINDIVNHTWPFYRSSAQNSSYLGSGPNSTSSSVTNISALNPDSDDPILQDSGASLFRPSPKTNAANRNGHSSTSINTLSSSSIASKNSTDVTPTKPAISETNAATRSLSPLRLIRKATSPNTNDNKQTKQSSSRFSDLFSGTFSTSNDNSQGNQNKNNNLSPNSANINMHGPSDAFIFQPGDYIYTFEQAIPSSYPETIKADYGFVEYYLFISIERFGAFKSNITAKFPITLVRTQADTSIEETEPIAISRDWEHQLHYDIVIASKDIILDAFLPIAFRFSPIDKVTLHRIRIYLTETIDYYCKGKKVHRVEPTKKFLLAEHNGPKLENLGENNNSSKAKYLGNLLVDDSTGDLVNKEFEYQVFVPNTFANKQALHPDTGYEKIKSQHWIKICLRLSRMIDGKRKHYEIVIDSPIHVLHKLCSHANTLLPSYDCHIPMVRSSSKLHLNSIHDSLTEAPKYHDSNIFFPKEVLLSPILSPEVHALDLKLDNGRNTRRVESNRKSDIISDEAKEVFNSPRLKANIYQPDNLQRELASPQAIPLSPIASPSMTSLNLQTDEEPPEFDFDLDTINSSSSNNKRLPNNPPTYSDVMRSDGVTSNSTNIRTLMAGKFNHKSQEKLEVMKTEKYSKHNSLNSLSYSKKRISDGSSHSSSSKSKEENIENLSNYGMNNLGPKSNPMLATSISRSNSSPIHTSNSQSNLISTNKVDAMHDMLPSTIRFDNQSYNDLNEILDIDDNDTEDVTSISSSINRTGISAALSLDGPSAQPLLHSANSEHNKTADESSFNSSDLIDDLITFPTESSIDITAFYHKNSNTWHPLQQGEINQLSSVSSNDYTFKVANSNNVLSDFKHALHDGQTDNKRLASIDSTSTLRGGNAN
ncbi:hypothetical protein Kpol_463p1 [Vanderwaltozyma polyspora DSM 70294]|uniref:Arrestin C-terminal-like domain-containing protein n=1 Tax=Vanderwaltozyma polyspora (strain ATCC 22028 / DSM 70294 / BCRC 21397 / CBS 2163 / NBRC 10782 / NRRL Y-8283 / UCD 57-17) TaxID=436907 RepID=A7TQI8_VANPO|nr:uncharacterized protein Kpol_463p1 [Vanderwaltozyma polyspora DSM 70294]EDO15452.1 hypothetical protein Kpol_463p1 [Vanderwaltozyma polyspora DSM 70294]